MIQVLIGKKIDQTQRFLQNGRRIPVTEILVADNTVVAVKTDEKDAYTAVQLGFGIKKKSTNALIGHVKKAGLKNVPQVLHEVAFVADDQEVLPGLGDILTVDSIFKPGDIVAVTGTSKGKGFAGVVKRHNFRGGPKTHGQSDRHRAPGSIGQTTTPGRVYKGKRMAGRMGTDTVTLKNLTVVDIDAKNKKLFVLGLVPGHKNAVVFIAREGERSNFIPMLESSYGAAAEAAMPNAVDAASNAVDEVKKDAASTSNVADADAAESVKPKVKEEKTVAQVEKQKEGEVTSAENSGEPREEKENGK